MSPNHRECASDTTTLESESVRHSGVTWGVNMDPATMQLNQPLVNRSVPQNPNTFRPHQAAGSQNASLRQRAPSVRLLKYADRHDRTRHSDTSMIHNRNNRSVNMSMDEDLDPTQSILVNHGAAPRLLPKSSQLSIHTPVAKTQEQKVQMPTVKWALVAQTNELHEAVYDSCFYDKYLLCAFSDRIEFFEGSKSIRTLRVPRSPGSRNHVRHSRYNALATSLDGDTIVAGTVAGNLEVHDLKDPNNIETLPMRNCINKICMQGPKCIVLQDSCLYEIDLNKINDANPGTVYKVPGSTLMDLTSQNQLHYVASLDGRIHTFDARVAETKVMSSRVSFQGLTKCSLFAPVGAGNQPHLIAAGTDQGEVAIYDLRVQHLLKTFLRPSPNYRNMCTGLYAAPSGCTSIILASYSSGLVERLHWNNGMRLQDERISFPYMGGSCNNICMTTIPHTGEHIAGFSGFMGARTFRVHAGSMSHQLPPMVPRTK